MFFLISDIVNEKSFMGRFGNLQDIEIDKSATVGVINK